MPARRAWTEGAAAIVVELNDNHFYTEKLVSVLDIQVTNLLDKPLTGVHLGLQGNFLGSHTWKTRLPAGGSARHKFEVVPGIAGEHLLNITASYVLDDTPAVWAAQPTLMVLARDENPSNLTVIFDQHMEAGRNLGYGLSIRNEVKEGFAKGVFHSVNDVLKQRFSDKWQGIGLSYDEDLSRQAGLGGPKEIEVVSTPDGGEAIDRLSLVIGEGVEAQRVLVLGKAAVSLGRRREDNEIVLRRLPRSKENDSLTLQVGGRHVTLTVNPRGLFLADNKTLNGTLLNDRPVKGEQAIPLDQPSEVDVAKAFRLRLIPFLEARDGPKVAAGRYARLGQPDETWLAAEKLGLRSLVIQRSDNPGQNEKYILVFRWFELGHGLGSEVVLPSACSARRCMRIVRIGGRFWLENLADEDCVSAGRATVPRGSACPLRRGTTLGCDAVTLHAEPYRQSGL